MGDPLVAISGGLSALAMLISLICFVLVLWAMFRHNRGGLAIVALIAFPVAFIMGWLKSKDWRLTRTMSIWSASLLIALVGGSVVGRNLLADGLPSFKNVEPTESQLELNKKADEIELDIDV